MSTALQVLASAVIGWLLLACLRFIRQRSKLLGLIVAGGFLLRAAGGLTLFVVGYLGLPIARSLQMGGGFWIPTMDATVYFAEAAALSEQGALGATDLELTSPLFVRVMSIWLTVVGISPIAGLYFNLCLYALFNLLLVKLCAPANDNRRNLPCIVAAAAMAFSPIIVLHSTQMMRDDLAYLVIALGCAGILPLLRLLVYSERQSPARIFVVIGLTTVAFVMLSELRWYFPVLMWGALVCTLALFLLRGRITALGRYAMGAIPVVLVLGFSAGLRFDQRSIVRLPAAAPADLGVVAQTARAEFADSGGATDIGSASGGRRDTSPAEAVAIGVAAETVPISVLKALSIVEFRGGRGLLPVTDVDTTILDALLLYLFVTLWRRRTALRGLAPFAVFVLTLSMGTALLLGYVVTNFGSLVRLRWMAAVPLLVLLATLPNSRWATVDRSVLSSP